MLAAARYYRLDVIFVSFGECLLFRRRELVTIHVAEAELSPRSGTYYQIVCIKGVISGRASLPVIR